MINKYWTVNPESRVQVPISIDDAAGITTGGIILQYDAQMLRAITVSTSDMLSGYYWLENIKPGEVRIAFTGVAPLRGKGELLYIEFEPISATPGAKSSLILKDVDLGARVKITKIHGSIEILPVKTALLANYPNPFNPETWIPYLLAEEAHVRVYIHDVKGRMIRKIDLGYQNAGAYVSKERAIYWDGRNNPGEKVSSGVYFYTLYGSKFKQTRRMLVVK